MNADTPTISSQDQVRYTRERIRRNLWDYREKYLLLARYEDETAGLVQKPPPANELREGSLLREKADLDAARRALPGDLPELVWSVYVHPIDARDGFYSRCKREANWRDMDVQQVKMLMATALDLMYKDLNKRRD